MLFYESLNKYYSDSPKSKSLFVVIEKRYDVRSYYFLLCRNQLISFFLEQDLNLKFILDQSFI